MVEAGRSLPQGAVKPESKAPRGVADGVAVALAAAAASLAPFFEVTTFGAFVKGLDGRYLRVNDQMTQVLGAESDAIVGATDDELLPKCKAAFTHGLDQRVAQGETIEGECDPDQPDGLWIRQAPMRDPDGNIVGIFGFARRGRGLARRRAGSDTAPDVEVRPAPDCGEGARDCLIELEALLRRVRGQAEVAMSGGISEDELADRIQIIRSGLEQATAISDRILHQRPEGSG